MVELLLDEGVPGRDLIGLEDTAAFVSMEDHSLAVVIHPTKSGEALQEALLRVLQLNPKAHYKLVMIGGGEEMRPLLEACQPGVMARRMVQVYQLADDGSRWSGRGSRLDSSVGRALEGAREVSAPVDAQALAARIRRPTQAELEHVESHRSFVSAYKSVRPVVTIGAVALIAGVFGLQMMWGGGSFLPTMSRMGANTEATLHGEPWRLLASTLLHGDGFHLAMNAVVLYVIGSDIERILGWRRQLVLLAVAGLFGSLASALQSGVSISVGASGAIWGLLGGALGIALRPAGLVPPAVVKNLKRAALINLLINVAVSFRPEVDFMAHLGGGVAGLGLVFSGVLTRGLAPVAEDPGRSGDGAWTLPAWVAGAATVGCLIWACVVGRPWELSSPPPLQDATLEGTSFSVRVPAPLSGRTEDQGAYLFEFGDPLSDAVTLSVAIDPWEVALPLTPENTEAWRNRDAALAKDAELVSREQIPGDEPPAYEEVHRFPNGAQVYVRYQLYADVEVSAAAVVFDGAPQGATEAAKAAIASVQRSPSR